MSLPSLPRSDIMLLAWWLFCLSHWLSKWWWETGAGGGESPTRGLATMIIVFIIYHKINTWQHLTNSSREVPICQTQDRWFRSCSLCLALGNIWLKYQEKYICFVQKRHSSLRPPGIILNGPSQETKPCRKSLMPPIYFHNHFWGSLQEL